MFIMNPTYGPGDALAALVVAYYRGASTGPLMSATKKAEELRDERNHGWRQGILEGMAEILNVERVKQFPHVSRFAKIGPHNVNKIMRERVLDNVVPNEAEVDAIVEKLLKLTDRVDEREASLAEENEKNRRAKVLAGEISPTSADRDGWLADLVAEREAEAEAIRRMVEGG